MSDLKVPSVLMKAEYMKLPPQERELYVREILRQTVNMNQQAVTISSLLKCLPFDSRTLEKHLSIMTYTNEIYTYNIGPTKVYSPNGRAIRPILQKKFSVEDREYEAYLLENRLGKFVFVQEKKKRGYAEDIGGGILVPFAAFSRFADFLQEVSEEINGGR